MTDCVGSRDYIDDGINGLLVAPGDSEAIVRAIRYLLANPDLEQWLQTRAFNSTRSRHTLDLYVKKILSLACELVGESS